MLPLVQLNYPLDLTRVHESACSAKEDSQPYTDTRYPELNLTDWHISRFSDEYIQQVMNDFEIDGRPRFYWLAPFATIPEHVDNGTHCSINLIITPDAAPITIEGVDYFYNQALLNTTIPHSVTNGATERIMLKISIFDETYEQLAKRIKYKQ